MAKRIVFLLLSSMLLIGCFAESMTLVSTGAGASQGRLIQSSLSSAASYGIKKTTGKFPIEHIITREKQRIAKKTKRAWGKGNSPKSAMKEFLKKNSRFVMDTKIDDKLQISVAPNGYLKCIR